MSWLELILIPLLASTLRVSTPLMFTAMGGLASERSGVINIALEGIMLMGAFMGAVGTLTTGSPWIGALCGMLGGLAIAAVYGLFVIRLRANQVVAGMAINMLAAGLTPFMNKLLYGSTSNAPGIPLANRFGTEPIWLAFFAVMVVTVWLLYTPSGLWLKFAGEHPSALDAAGIRVNRVRWKGVLLSGLLAGMGGVTLSVFLSSSFSRNMTAGRGYMALAALIFGKWRPVQAAAACLLFGFADALQIRLQGVILWGTEPVPVQFIQILPYIVTILVLAGLVGQSRAPKALGFPFEKA